MNNRLIILAGGISSRMKNSIEDQSIDKKLQEDADKKSKSMIRLGENDRPFLDYLLFNVIKAGYKEIVILTNDKDNSIREYYSAKVEKFRDVGMNLSFAVQPIPEGREKPLGTADALYHALMSKPEWKGKKFTMCNSDNLYSVNVLVTLLHSQYKNSMIDYDRAGLNFEKDRTEKFAITNKDSEGYITDIIEKPDKEEIDKVMARDGYVGVSMNIFEFSYDMILPFLKIVPLNPIRVEKELPAAIKLMIEKLPKSLYAFPVKEHVPDLTNKTDILNVKEYLENEFKDFFFNI